MDETGTLIELFDLEDYLVQRNIPYSTDGKNVSADWIGTSCPFCSFLDPSNHLGIHQQHKTISCWRCGIRGTIIKYIMKVEKCRFTRAKEIMRNFALREIPRYEQTESVWKPPLQLPTLEKFPTNSIGYDYLRRRFLHPAKLISRYDLKWVGPTPFSWRYRIIIPIYYHHKLICFTARSVSPNEIKYKNCPNEISLVSAKECLYNLDSVRDTAIVVEGPTDVWTLGDGAVATLGTQFTVNQLIHLQEVNRVFIMYDADVGNEKKEELAGILSNFISHVEIISLSEGDPGALPEEDVRSLRKQIFGKIY